MAGPWEKYAAAEAPAKEAGPWQKYAPQAKGPGPIFQPVEDVVGAFRGAYEKFTGDLKDDYAKTTAPKTLGQELADSLPALGRSARNVGNLAGLAMSPLTALTDATIVGPGARAAAHIPLFNDVEQNKQAISTALMGLRAGPLRTPVAPAAALPEAAASVDLAVAPALRRAIKRDMQTPEQVIAAARANPGAPAFHAGGDNLRGLAEVVAKSPGPGAKIVPEVVKAHQAQATDRVSAKIAEGLGGKNDYFATVDAVKDSRLEQAQPFLQKAFAEPIDPLIYQAEIDPIMKRLPRGALEHAYDIARRDGRDPKELGLIVEKATGGGPGVLGGEVTVRVSNPKLETLHYVKKGLDQTLEQYRNPVTQELNLSGSPGAQADSRVRSALGRTMREINPNYDEGMRIWGDESDHLSALSLGRDVFSPKFDMQAERMARQVGDMSEASRDMFRKGVGEAVLAQTRTKGGVPAARKLLQSREFGDRIRLAFPSQQSFEEFMASIGQEVAMQEKNSRVIGGSPTYPLQAARADLEQQGLDPIDAISHIVEGGLNPRAAAANAVKAGLKAIPRKDRSVIGDPALNEAVARALSDPDVLQRVLGSQAQQKARTAAIARGRGGLALRLAPPALSAAQTNRR